MLTLKESFENVKIICHNASLKREEWLAVDESLNNIAGALQAHEVMLVAAKEERKESKPKDRGGIKEAVIKHRQEPEPEEPQLEDEPDEEIQE